MQLVPSIGAEVASPFIATVAIWVLWVFALLRTVVTHVRSRTSLCNSRHVLGVFALVLLASATTWLVPLYGREYEDAFEYEYSGLLLARNPEAREYGLNSVCVDGSLRECRTLNQLPHPIGLAVLVSGVDKALGEHSPSRHLQIISTFCWALCGSCVFLLGKRIGLPNPAALLGASSLVSVPLWLALSSSSFAEPTATAIAACTLVALLGITARFTSPPVTPKLLWELVPQSFSVIAGVALAVCVKREQMILVVVLPLIHAVRVATSAKMRTLSTIGIVALGSMGVAVADAATHGAVLQMDTVKPSSRAAFEFANAALLAPRYLEHLFDVRAYGPLLPFIVAGAVLSPRRREVVALSLAALVYASAFCSFSQSYYFIQHGEIPWLHFQRYTLELVPFLAILSGIAFEQGMVLFRRARAATVRIGIFVAAVLLLLAMVQQGFAVRGELSEDEEAVRIRPIRTICGQMPNGSWSITFTPLLYTLVCGDSRLTISVPSIGSQIRTAELQRRVRNETFFYHQDMWSDPGRYPLAGAALNTVGKRLVESDPEFQLYVLSAPEEHRR